MPRKNVAGFPGRAERERLMNELRGSNDPQITAFANAVKALDGVMKTYETPQGPYGLAPTLKAADKTKLMNAILTAAQSGEAYLAAAEKGGKDMTKGVPALAEELQSLLSVNYDALARYEPNMGLSLPELQQAARTVTVDMRGTKLGSFMNAQNSRLRMSVADADGTRRQGFFTMEKRVSILDAYQKALTEAKRLCGNNQDAANALQGFLKAYGEKNKRSTKFGIDPSLSEENALAFLTYAVGDVYKKGSAKGLLQKAGINADNIPQKAIDALDAGLAASKKNIGDRLNVKELKLQDGTRLDDRNVSMSSVADLLGVPGLLAKSTAMRCVDQDGKVVEGTFMDYADGVDLNEPEPFAKVTDDLNDLYAAEESHFVKDMLDMQVLDYICGNVDRHDANMTYKLNDKGQIIGVQGIDNDSSFGLFKNVKTGQHHMVGLDNLRVMSKSMYERIQNTTPEMLKLSLRGSGRSLEEIEFACDRLKDLKDLIKEKKPTVHEKGSFGGAKLANGYHVVPDEDLSGISPRSFKLFMPNTLISRTVKNIDEKHEAAKKIGPEYKRAHYLKNKEAFDKRPDMPELGTNERKFTAGGLGDSLREVSALYKNEATGRFIENDTGYWRRSSGAFRDMVRAAAGAAKIQKNLTETLSRNPDKEKLLRDDPSITADKKKADDAMTALNNKVDDYLARKRNQRGVQTNEQLVQNAKNDYERERIRYALSLKQAVQNYRDLDNPNVQAETHEKETAQTVLQTAQNRKAAQEAAGPAAHN